MKKKTVHVFMLMTETTENTLQCVCLERVCLFCLNSLVVQSQISRLPV